MLYKCVYRQRYWFRMVEEDYASADREVTVKRNNIDSFSSLAVIKWSEIKLLFTLSRE